MDAGKIEVWEIEKNGWNAMKIGHIQSTYWELRKWIVIYTKKKIQVKEVNERLNRKLETSYSKIIPFNGLETWDNCSNSLNSWVDPRLLKKEPNESWKIRGFHWEIDGSVEEIEEIRWNSMGNWWSSMKIDEARWKLMKLDGARWKIDEVL